MEKIDMLKSIIDSLPEEYKTKFIVFKNNVMPFTEFLETEFINYFPDNASIDYIVGVIIQNFQNRINDLDTLKYKKIDKFIKDNSIEDINFREEAFSRMNSSLKFNMGEVEQDIDYFYQIYMSNLEQVTFSYEEKMDMLEMYLNSYLELELQEFVLEEYNNMTVREFVFSYLIKHINDRFEIDVDLGLNSDIDVEQTIMIMADYVRDKVKTIEEERKLEELNHTKENPSLVPEIKAILNKDNQLEVTHEIPVIVPPLTEEEIAGLTVDISDEEIINDLISDIKEYLYHCNNQEMIQWVELQLSTLVELINSKERTIDYSSYIAYVYAKLEEIKKSVIKIESNKGDYVDAMFGEISLGKTNTDLTKISDEIEKKNITDNQLNGTVIREKREIAKKNILGDFKVINHERFFIDAEIEYRIIVIKNLKKEVEATNAANNYLAGKQIKYELAIKDFERFINEANISEEDRTSYISIINGIINENKNGIGRV